MRNILRKVYLLIPVFVMLGACEEPEQEVFSQIPSDVVTTSTDPKVIAVLKQGAYNSLIGNWGGHNSLWSLQEVSSDELVITQKGADWEDGGQWIRVHQHDYLPTEQAIGNGWGYCYGAIADINLLLLQFGQIEDLRRELEVLRAMVYLWLLDAYGNVPIIREDDTNPTPSNNTRAEVYAFIEASVLNNIDELPKEASYVEMNYYVAQAILAKLYLNASVYINEPQWQKAADAAAAIIDDGAYSLSSNFFSNFSANNRASTENIFVIPYDENIGGGFNLAQMTLHYSSQASFDLQEQPWNGYSSLQDFYNSFDEDDDRIGSFLEGPQFSSTGERLTDVSAEAADPDGEPLTFTPFITELFPNALRQEGVRVGKFEFQNGAGQSLSNDFPIFRLADIMLMKAEALWRINSGDAEALSLVNQIRQRAGLGNLAILTEDELLAERGRELFAEGHRRSDLIRFGRFNNPW
ncbi:MAG: RagB/SusD family nutrient uptake outer membrane protein, partial [Cyclobacteriaceae bacterium]